MAPLPSRLATPGSIIELVHSGDRESLHCCTALTLTLPDDRLRCSSCFACDETKPMWICNGDEPMRVSPLHSMLVRMPRGTTGDAFRAAMRTASAHVDPRVPLTDLALPTGKHSRLGERLV